MIGDSYITIAQLGTYLGINTAQSDPIRDAKLTTAVVAASETIETHCRRQFNTNGIVETRYFVPTSPHLVIVDDFYDVDTLVIQRRPIGDSDWQTPWTFPNFELEPRNGIVNGQPGWPFRRITLPYWTFLWAIDRLKIQATWGWQSVPGSVVQAALILGAEYYKLSDAPLGAAGFGSGSDGFNVITVKDVPQAWSLLKPYILNPITVY
jgi:hypothetical protein